MGDPKGSKHLGLSVRMRPSLTGMTGATMAVTTLNSPTAGDCYFASGFRVDRWLRSGQSEHCIPNGKSCWFRDGRMSCLQSMRISKLVWVSLEVEFILSFEMIYSFSS